MFFNKRKSKKTDYELLGDSETHKSLINTISGYKSYEDVKKRYETDQAIRKFLYNKVINLTDTFSKINTYLMQNQMLATWKAANDIKNKLDELQVKLLAPNADIYRHSTFFDTPDVSEWLDIPVIYVIESEMIVLTADLKKEMEMTLSELSNRNLDEIANLVGKIRADVSELYTMIMDRAELFASFEIVKF